MWIADSTYPKFIQDYSDEALDLLNPCQFIRRQGCDAYKNKLKGLKVLKWRKDEWRMMKEWRMNEWRMKDEGWWFQGSDGFCRLKDKQTDICECRIAFATEKNPYGGKLSQPQFTPSTTSKVGNKREWNFLGSRPSFSLQT